MMVPREPSHNSANPTSTTTTLWTQIGKCRLSQRLRPPGYLSPPIEQTSPALKAAILVCKHLGHHLFVPRAVLEKF